MTAGIMGLSMSYRHLSTQQASMVMFFDASGCEAGSGPGSDSVSFGSWLPVGIRSGTSISSSVASANIFSSCDTSIGLAPTLACLPTTLRWSAQIISNPAATRINLPDPDWKNENANVKWPATQRKLSFQKSILAFQSGIADISSN